MAEIMGRFHERHQTGGSYGLQKDPNEHLLGVLNLLSGPIVDAAWIHS